MAMVGVVILFVGCSGGEKIQLKDVGYRLEVEPPKKIEELPKELRPQRGQSGSHNMRRDPTGLSRN
jgi:hypothetical protein